MNKSCKMKLYWDLTNECNLQCRYCYYNVGLENRVLNLNFPNNYKEVIKDISKNFDEVVFVGGEPLLHPKIFELIEFFKTRHLKVSLLTNGVLLNKYTSRKIIQFKVDNIAISLDSLDVEVNDYLREKTSKVLVGIKNILSLRPKNVSVEIMQTITRKNISSIRPMVEFCHKNHITLWLSPVEISHKSKTLEELNLEHLSSAELSELEKLMKLWANNFNRPVLLDYISSCLALIRGEKTKKIYCPMGTESFVLEPDGNLYPCFLRKDILLGNVYKQKIGELLRNPRLRQQQKNLEKGVCVRLGCVCMTISSSYLPNCCI